MAAIVTSARVVSASGRVAATIDLVEVGGGSQTVTVDGTPEERIHPARQVHHVRLLSPDRMIPDELREADSYEAAVELGERYASLLDEHAERVDRLAADLRV
jgi:hypothetical protein